MVISEQPTQPGATRRRSAAPRLTAVEAIFSAKVAALWPLGGTKCVGGVLGYFFFKMLTLVELSIVVY